MKLAEKILDKLTKSVSEADDNVLLPAELKKITKFKATALKDFSKISSSLKKANPKDAQTMIDVLDEAVRNSVNYKAMIAEIEEIQEA